MIPSAAKPIARYSIKHKSKPTSTTVAARIKLTVKPVPSNIFFVTSSTPATVKKGINEKNKHMICFFDLSELKSKSPATKTYSGIKKEENPYAVKSMRPNAAKTPPLPASAMPKSRNGSIREIVHRAETASNITPAARKPRSERFMNNSLIYKYRKKTFKA